jgi:hypothetical protein
MFDNELALRVNASRRAPIAADASGGVSLGVAFTPMEATPGF